MENAAYGQCSKARSPFVHLGVHGDLRASQGEKKWGIIHEYPPTIVLIEILMEFIMYPPSNYTHLVFIYIFSHS